MPDSGTPSCRHASNQSWCYSSSRPAICIFAIDSFLRADGISIQHGSVACAVGIRHPSFVSAERSLVRPRTVFVGKFIQILTSSLFGTASLASQLPANAHNGDYATTQRYRLTVPTRVRVQFQAALHNYQNKQVLFESKQFQHVMNVT